MLPAQWPIVSLYATTLAMCWHTRHILRHGTAACTQYQHATCRLYACNGIAYAHSHTHTLLYRILCVRVFFSAQTFCTYTRKRTRAHAPVDTTRVRRAGQSPYADVHQRGEVIDTTRGGARWCAALSRVWLYFLSNFGSTMRGRVSCSASHTHTMHEQLSAREPVCMHA